MTIGALLDAGGDFSYLKEELKKLSFDDEYTLEVQKVIKNGITATKFDVVLKHDNRPHTHEQHSKKAISLTDTVMLIFMKTSKQIIMDMAIIIMRNIAITTMDIATIIMEDKLITIGPIKILFA